jgi:hypothetical protein
LNSSTTATGQGNSRRDHCAERQDDREQRAAKLRELRFERSAARAHALDERAYPDDLGARACGRDDEPRPALGDGGAHMHHVDPVPKRRVRRRDRGVRLGDGERTPR